MGSHLDSDWMFFRAFISGRVFVVNRFTFLSLFPGFFFSSLCSCSLIQSFPYHALVIGPRKVENLIEIFAAESE